MSDDNVTSSVQDRYAPQFAQELARNEQEQKELEARLAQLRDDHAALSGMLAALGHETTPTPTPTPTPTAEPPASTTAATAVGESVPRQRRPRKKPASSTGTAAAKPKSAKPQSARPTSAKPKSAKKAAPKSTAKSTAKSAAKPESKAGAKGGARSATKTAAKAPAKGKQSANPEVADPKSAATAAKNGAARTPGGPTLQDVIAGLLGVHAPERRTVREIFDELKQKHPERASSTQSVRNALNGLLRKGAIEREEKQGAVWFGTATADATPAGDATATSATSATPATAPAPAEPTGEKAKAAADA
ncbi:hypothetical protein [Streptomyces sp. Da 82-17]|uniref:hypothetical protein n=1 Tax=Streptomyces sp. Da 82-17 TaxID=3377116 RepID=UPI0038D46204